MPPVCRKNAQTLPYKQNAGPKRENMSTEENLIIYSFLIFKI